MLPHNFNGFWSPAFWNSLSASSQSSAQTAENVGYNLWQMPLCYWQTVSTIMGLRSKSAAALTQNWLECCQQLSQCKTPAQATTCLQTGYQNALNTLVALNLDTHQTRAELWNNWQILAKRSLPQSGQAVQGGQPYELRFVGNLPQIQPSQAQQPQAQPVTPSSTSVQPTVQPKGWFVAGTPTKNGSKPQPIATFEPKNTLPLPNPTPIPTPFPGSLPIKQPEPNPKPIPMAVGQSFHSQNLQSDTPATSSPSTPQSQALPSQTGTIISSTSTSVVRSSSGATVASAAATRRSVLARHTSRKGRLGRSR